jgi:N-acetylmuramoyl-L-alanine amidase
MNRLFRPGRLLPALTLPLALAAMSGCRSIRPGTLEPRKGDEIVVAGQFIHTGTRVVLWMDPGGYDAYRVERRFSPLDESDWADSQAQDRYLTTPNRYGMRRHGLTAAEIERVRGGGWDLPTLQKVIDQFVIHYDACGTSRQCFKELQDVRDLSVHFLLDLDGTLYQTLDLKERAWHATTSNGRSIGIEIANIGAYGLHQKKPFQQWYAPDGHGGTRITIPARFGDGGVRTRHFVGHPARPEPIIGIVQGKRLIQYDFTPQQYQALIKLTATLVRIFPKLRCDYPRDAQGKLITHKLSNARLQNYEGLLGHFHVQTDKVDPGPAFQWDSVLKGVRRLLNGGMSPMASQVSLGHMRRRF